MSAEKLRGHGLVTDVANRASLGITGRTTAIVKYLFSGTNGLDPWLVRIERS